jgi:hypothetical protein
MGGYRSASLQLRRLRAEEEASCEERLPGSVEASREGRGGCEAVPGGVAGLAALGLGSLENASCHALDGTVRELSRALARPELELSLHALEFHRSASSGGGFRRLGYASEAQLLRARRALGRRLEKLPRVAEVLGAGPPPVGPAACHRWMPR